MSIILVNKAFNLLKVGLLGFRQNLLEQSLKNNGINYVSLTKAEEITEDLDFVFATGVYYIIKEPYLSAPKHGILCFHETPIPEGAGHCPIAWTVLSGRQNMTITLFKMAEEFDTGEIAYQYNIPFDKLDTYDILEKKREQGIRMCFDEFLNELSTGSFVLRKQTGNRSYSARRSPKDSELDINKTIKEQWDNFRICDNTNFPAYFIISEPVRSGNYGVYHNIKVTLKYEVEEL